jgi:uncharacterized membrane protein
MDDVTIARALHVVSVVLWIGGVAFVTAVLLPAVRHLNALEKRIQLFEQIEQRFAWQARISTAIVGLTGFYMLYRLDMWDRFRRVAYWWIDAMVVVWLLSQQCFLLPNRSSCAGAAPGNTSAASSTRCDRA